MNKNSSLKIELKIEESNCEALEVLFSDIAFNFEEIGKALARYREKVYAPKDKDMEEPTPPKDRLLREDEIPKQRR